uniref:Uncharacterized protein n=1 Tax=Anguilla anguilla TaxID=7936 RepID=A0A0E9UEQ3_ANGAN
MCIILFVKHFHNSTTCQNSARIEAMENKAIYQYLNVDMNIVIFVSVRENV